ncbi:hypothetical protein ACOMHN_028321 [Nucella lapillus]
MLFRLRFPRYPRDHDSLETVNVSQLHDSEKWRIAHQRLHEKHRSHEVLHGEVAVVVLVILLAVQIALMLWKRRHFRSYQLVTLLGMWLIPVVVCVRWGWTRFLLVWTPFSLITLVICRRASRKPLAGTTPRWVYKWFLLIDKLSYLLGIMGYAFVMSSVFGLGIPFLSGPQLAMDSGLLLLFYGLYFGVIARDVAEVCTDTMAAHIGYYSSSGLPSKMLDEGVCAVCGNQIMVSNAEAIFEKTVQLNCDHVWERSRALYGMLLGWIRYLVSWQPVIILLVKGVNWILGME